MACESTEEDFSEPSIINYNASSDEYIPTESELSGKLLKLNFSPKLL